MNIMCDNDTAIDKNNIDISLYHSGCGSQKNRWCGTENRLCIFLLILL